jgi:protease YdgD
MANAAWTTLPDRLTVALLVAAVAVSGATARQIPLSTLPGIGGGSARVLVDVTAAPWFAVGRVQTELGTLCTGALIGPSTVLTAAHCLAAPGTLRYVQPSSIHFLLGYSHGDYTAHARAVSFVTGRDETQNTPSARTVTPSDEDWAVVTLASRVARPDRILPVQFDPPPAGTRLVLGGYEQDRAHAMVADLDCTLLGMSRGAGGRLLLHHSCAGTRGASGGPLLAQRTDGTWQVVGIAVTANLGDVGGHAFPIGAIDRVLLDNAR